MKTGLTLTQLAQEIERRREAKRDFISPQGRIMIEPEEKRMVMRIASDGSAESFNIRDTAHGQLSTRLAIPKKYYDRMLYEQPALLASNVNTWLADSPNDKRMVRVLNNQVRAVLSDRYQRIENEEVAEMVLPVLMEQTDMEIVSSQITESRLYIKALFPRIGGDVKVGDRVISGAAISNSEIGMGALKVERLSYRLVCLNGAISPDASYRAFHIGARHETSGVEELFSDETLAAEDNTKLLKVRDVLRACASQEAFDKDLNKMREAAGERIQGDPVKAVEILAKKMLLREDERGSVLRHLVEGGDLSRWGVLNAVTRAAQDVESYDRATEMETMGGYILDLPRGDWRELAMAA